MLLVQSTSNAKHPNKSSPSHTITLVEEDFYNKTDYPQYDVVYFQKKKNKGKGMAAMQILYLSESKLLNLWILCLV